MKKITTEYKDCSVCKGTGRNYNVFVKISKFKSIVKKYKLSTVKLSSIMGISQSVISLWLSGKGGVRGVRKKYFDMLEKKGYK